MRHIQRDFGFGCARIGCTRCAAVYFWSLFLKGGRLLGYGNVYEQYKEQSVNTMTSGELLVLLYDEIIKRLVRAKIFMEKDNQDGFDADVKRAREIIQYFEQTLDYKYPISQNLYRLYDYMLYELARVQASRALEPMGEVLTMVTELRDTWKEADRRSRIK